jgi:hypothetical protein
MSDELDAAAESAKAVQEVAKTTGKALDAARGVGAFFAKIVGGPLEQTAGLLEDRLAHMRAERQMRFMAKTEQLIRELGIEHHTRPVPLKIALPILQAATIEDNDDLQDMWAHLLANATNPASAAEVTVSMVTILKDFGTLEASILNAVYNAPDPIKAEGVPTLGLPRAYIDQPSDVEQSLPDVKTQFAVWNLIRLGCLAARLTWDGPHIGRVNITTLGTTLIEACLKPKN